MGNPRGLHYFSGAESVTRSCGQGDPLGKSSGFFCLRPGSLAVPPQRGHSCFSPRDPPILDSENHSQAALSKDFPSLFSGLQQTGGKVTHREGKVTAQGHEGKSGEPGIQTSSPPPAMAQESMLLSGVAGHCFRLSNTLNNLVIQDSGVQVVKYAILGKPCC